MKAASDFEGPGGTNQSSTAWPWCRRLRPVIERIGDRLDAALDEPDEWQSFVIEALSEVNALLLLRELAA